MMYNNGYMPQTGYYPTMNNGAVPDNLAMLRGQNPYQPNYPQYQGMQHPTQSAQANSSSMIWVSSEREAMEYPLAPNTAVALWDSNAPIVYLKQADASGKPTFEPYDLVKRQPMGAQQPVQTTQIQTKDFITRDEFNALEAKIDGYIHNKSTTKSSITED